MRAGTRSAVVHATPWPGSFCTHLESDHRYDRHFHETIGIGYVADGAHISASGRGRVRAYAGDVIANNPGEIHDGEPLGTPTRRWRLLHLEPSLFAATVGSSDIIEIARPVFRDARAAALLEHLFRRIEVWNETRPRSGALVLACEEALVETCALLGKRHVSGARPAADANADMRGVRACLEANLASPPTLAELAAIVGLSRYQVLRRFRRQYGLPPHAWLIQRRAERARRLIARGERLSEAAASSGFADQSHMTRVFIRQFGFTPGVWRSAMQLQ
jgi:AraC-like DNA-binding protein